MKTRRVSSGSRMKFQKKIRMTTREQEIAVVVLSSRSVVFLLFVPLVLNTTKKLKKRKKFEVVFITYFQLQAVLLKLPTHGAFASLCIDPVLLDKVLGATENNVVASSATRDEGCGAKCPGAPAEEKERRMVSGGGDEQEMLSSMPLKVDKCKEQ